MTCPEITLDSNVVGLRYAEEECPAVLKLIPAELTSVVWKPCDPNSYGDFGSTYTSTPRNTINPSRQKKKGSITDSTTNASYQQDFVQHSLTDLMQGFFYADWRKKSTATATAVTASSFTVGADATNFSVGDLLFGSGFGEDNNNGMKKVTAVTGTSISVAGLSVEASPPSISEITKVGIEAATDDLEITVSSNVASLESTVLDFTTLGIIAGEWIVVGGDATINQFSNADSMGFYRVKSVVANKIVFDRTPTTPTVSTGAGKKIRVFFGNVLRNEYDTNLIKRRTYCFERKFTDNAFEYINGATPNSFNFSIPEAGNIVADLGFMGLNSEDVDTRKAGDFSEKLPAEEVFTSTSSLMNMRMIEEDTNATLYTIVPNSSFSIANNVSPVKAAGYLGAVKTTIGDFSVSGSATVFFTSIESVQAVKNNDSVSMDFQLIADNQGWLFDLPYLTLGDGKKNVAKDSPITLNLSTMASEHPTLGYTFLVQKFEYLPTFVG